MKGRFLEIDGLRAVAISLVVLFHYTKEFYPHIHLFSFGWSGVDLFFVISGFVLYLQVKKKYYRDDKADFASYFRNRILRIVPAYYASLAAMLLFFGRDKIFSAGFLMHLSFFHIFDHDVAVSIQPLYWTLAVEIQFYLFIILAAPLLTGRHGMAWMITLIVFTMVYRMVFPVAWNALSNAGLVMSNILPGRIAEFCYGMIIAKIYIERPFLFERLGRSLERRSLAALSLFILAFCWIVWLKKGDGLFAYRMGTVLYYPVLGLGFGLFFLSVLLMPLLKRIFSYRPVVFVGTVSYSIYLWHIFIILFMSDYLKLADRGAGPGVRMMIALVLTLAVSTLSYYLIEKTFLGFKK
jgi:peptidoglycan/LPS O-acetylase OafA/YrhL